MTLAEHVLSLGRDGVFTAAALLTGLFLCRLWRWLFILSLEWYLIWSILSLSHLHYALTLFLSDIKLPHACWRRRHPSVLCWCCGLKPRCTLSGDTAECSISLSKKWLTAWGTFIAIKGKSLWLEERKDVLPVLWHLEGSLIECFQSLPSSQSQNQLNQTGSPRCTWRESLLHSCGIKWPTRTSINDPTYRKWGQYKEIKRL